MKSKKLIKLHNNIFMTIATLFKNSLKFVLRWHAKTLVISASTYVRVKDGYIVKVTMWC